MIQSNILYKSQREAVLQQVSLSLVHFATSETDKYITLKNDSNT